MGAFRFHKRRAAPSSASLGPSAGHEDGARALGGLAPELRAAQAELALQSDTLHVAEEALAAARERYFELYDAAPVAYVDLDRLGAILHANQAAAALLGASESALAMRKLSTFMSAADGDVFQRFRQAVFASDALHRCVLELVTARGGVSVHLEARLRRDPAGEASSWLCVILDRSELRLAEAETRGHKAHAAALLRTATDAIIGVSEGGRIESFNDAATALFGFDEREIVGCDLRTLSPESLCAPGARDIRSYFAPGQEQVERPVNPERVGRRKDGTTFPFELGVAQWRGDGYLRSAVVVRDVSVRRRDEARLRESEARLRLIAERIDDALVLQEEDGRISYASPAYARIWGAPAPAFCEHRIPWFRSVHPEDRARAAVAHGRLLVGDGASLECRIIRADGTVRRIRARFFPVAGDGGDVLQHVAVAQDVTEQRALEHELQQAHKLELVGMLASAIAHDFGNLLQVMSGSVALALAEARTSAEHDADLRNLLEASRRGAALVNQLMTFCNKREVRPEPTDFDRVIDELGGLLARLVGESIRVTVATASGGVVMVDRVQIEQLLMNLASNARDAMPDGGQLTIATDEVWIAKGGAGELAPGRYVRLAVRDTGCGMDAATLARVFEPFFTTKSPGVGTGLGLATALGIVKGLRGRIEAASVVGGGTSFEILVPCCDEAVLEVPAVAAPEALEGRILIVEDAPAVRLVVRRHLVSLGLEVVEAEDGASALAVAEAGRFDVLLTDIGMAGMSGAELARALLARHPGMRVIFMSGYPAADLIERNVIEPSAVLLQKPFGKEELCQRLAAVLPARGGSTPVEGART